MGKHTPAPWSFCEKEHTKDAAGNYLHLTAGRLDDYDDERNEGFSLAGFISREDAALIAAAPDLLQSLEEIIKCLDEDGSFDKFPDPTSISGRARAAVAKARGQS